MLRLFRPGPVSQVGFLDWHNTVTRILRGLTIQGADGTKGGEVVRDVSGHNWKLVIGTGGGVKTIVVGGSVRWNIGAEPDDDPLPGVYLGAPSATQTWIRVPYDGVTTPTYMTDAEVAVAGPGAAPFDWEAMPADDGTDDRANALYEKIGNLGGPVFHVLRA